MNRALRPKKLPLFLKLDPEILGDLKRIAASDEVTMTSIVESALHNYMPREIARIESAEMPQVWWAKT